MTLKQEKIGSCLGSAIETLSPDVPSYLTKDLG